MEKLVQRRPTSCHRCIPIMQTRILRWRITKNPNFSTVMQGRGDCKTSRISTAPGKLAAMVQEIGASAKRTQADHSRRESLMSNSSQELRASGNLLQRLHQGTRNRETNSRVQFSNTLIRQIWEDLFLTAIKIIFSVRQDLNL